MIHTGIEKLKRWNTDEYAAGYRARLNALPNSELTDYCWQCGWDEADTELLESARHIEVLVEDGEDDYPGTWGLLFDGGGNARMNGITFEEGRTKPWKEGWIAADINLGMAMGTAK